MLMRRNGHSLVELLVATAIIAILLGLATVGVGYSPGKRVTLRRHAAWR
jgi:prepilin-type N-terminal cleavage/methylation domain-containing protein